ncbi:DUF2282 domain-containing protein [Nitrospirillum sp. BR 11752]|uniref:BufA1 family periplasmic bufferin-type metallophore n=1 Tax=Nitrospirillum sp. BR 11752 TaxID=3104293 RepID=UPI002EBCB438|nr:DUF2282 domain-containing protein [Nitrospirillum sp. BR 11752]
MQTTITTRRTASHLGLGLIVATAVAGATLAAAPAKAADMEKCYGVVKAGHNDCKTDSNSCAGHATKDRDPGAFIAVPAGTCAKIAGGSTEPAKK